MTELGQQRLNEEQRVAVASMLLGVAGGRPFALNGPPGTGKTVTLVEMGLQVRPARRLAGAAVFERAARAMFDWDHSAAAASLSWDLGTGAGSCIHECRAAYETQT